LSYSGNSEQKEAREIAPRTVTLVLFGVYLLFPFGVQIRSEANVIDYVIFGIPYTYFWYPPDETLLWIDPMFAITSVANTFLRLVFIFMLYRYYTGNSTKTRTLLTGIAGELQYTVIFLIAFNPFHPWPYNYLFILPIPVLLVIGAVIMKLFSPPMIELWKDDSSDESWWDQSYKDEEQPL
jgi:hypothetical protein